MISGGVEVTIGVLEEQMFGPLVLFGLAGAGMSGLTGADYAKAVPPQGPTHRIVLADAPAAARR